MTEQEKQSIKYNIHAADSLKKLIAENPDLPLVVLVGDEANTGDYSYMFATSVSAEIGEILDCQQEIKDDVCFTDRDEFEEAIADGMSDSGDYDNLEDWEFEEIVAKKAAEYEPYWRKCILLTVDN